MGGTVDVIVVTYNSADVVERCIASLDNPHVGDVIVVDNGSTDRTIECLRRQSIEPHELAGNPGYTIAANVGARHSRAETIAFVNPDCEVPPAFWADVLHRIDSAPHACVVPRHLTCSDGITRGRQPGYTRMKLVYDMLGSNYFGSRLQRYLERLPGYHDHAWYWPHGACIVMRRRLFDEIGGLAEEFPMYMDDVVLGRKLHDRGGLVLESDVDVVHHGGQGARVTSLQRLALLNRGRIAYCARYHGAGFARFLWALSRPGFMLRRTLGVGR